MKELEDLKYHISTEEGLELWEKVKEQTTATRREYQTAVATLRGIAANINAGYPKDVL